MGLWKSYKAFPADVKLTLDSFMRVNGYADRSDINFDTFANLTYFPAHAIQARVASIKLKLKRDKELIDALDENWKWEESQRREMQDVIKNEYYRQGFDPEYIHHGLDQENLDNFNNK